MSYDDNDVFTRPNPDDPTFAPGADITTPLPGVGVTGDDPPYDWMRGDVLGKAQSELQTMFDTPAPDTRYLVEGLIPAGMVGVLAAATKTGKSFFITEVTLLGSMGQNVFGMPVPEPFPVVYLNGEDPGGPFHQRIENIARDLIPEGIKSAPNFYPLLLNGEPKLFTEIVNGAITPRYDVVDRLVAIVEGISGTPGLFVVDTLARFHGGLETNEHLGAFIAVCERLAKLTGWSVLISHHISQNASLSGTGLTLEAVRGATSLVSNTRFHIGLQTMTEQEAKDYNVDFDCRKNFVHVASGGFNYGPHMADFWLQRSEQTGVLSPVHLQLIPKSKAAQPELHDAIADFIRTEAEQDQWYSRTGLSRKKGHCFEVGRHTIDGAVNAMLDAGELIEIPLPEQANKADYKNITKVLSA